MSEFLRVAERLIEQEMRALTPREIVDLGFKCRLFSDQIAGKTPHQTMKSKLSVHVLRQGASSLFVRTAPGRFHLRRLVSPTTVYSAPRQQFPPSDEQVLVFPSSLLRGRERFQGISKKHERIKRLLERPQNTIYMDRFAAEGVDDHKQVLTYIMLTRGRSVLAYKRGNFNRAEDFLRGAHCIGFGGHVSYADVDLFSLGDLGIARCAARELMEELRLPDLDKHRLAAGTGLHLVGALNDDSSIVGERHFAFLFKYEVSSDPSWHTPERGEKSITQLRWLNSRSGTVPIWDFEYWSQLCLREYFPTVSHAVAQYRIIRKRPLRPPNLLCIIGAVGSGKSEATRLITKECGYSEINTGKLVAKMLGIPPVPDTPRDAFQSFAWKFIQSPDGPEKLATAIWEGANKVANGRVLIDGIRQGRTLECLREKAGSARVGVIFVDTLIDLAYKFYCAREARGISIFEFLKLRNAEVETEVPGLIEQSDAVLHNWTGRAEYQRAVRDLMSSAVEE